MAKIVFKGDREVEIDKNKTVLQASLDAGIPHTNACGGNARCSTCRVWVFHGLENCNERNEKERALASERMFDPRIRLACQTKLSGDIVCKRLVRDEEDIMLLCSEEEQPHKTASGKEIDVAVFFSDIRGFTTLSENNLPYDVIHILNKYFNRVCPFIDQNKGIVDKFIGDGIMAVFGIGDNKNPTLSAIKCGLEQLKALKEFNSHLKESYGIELKIGIGIHYGKAIIGNVGYHGKYSLTAIGDTVNVAARVESSNKPAGTEMLISQEAYNQVKSKVTIGKKYETELKGKTGKHILYEVAGIA